MTEPVTIKFHHSPEGYEDHYVSRGRLSFAFVSQDNKMVGPLVDCKGYMSNRIQASILGKTIGSQYVWRPNYGKIDLEATRLLIARQDVTETAWNKEVNSIIKLTNDLEVCLGLIRSNAFPVLGVPDDYGKAMLIVGSKRWMLAPPMINLYVWLLRNGIFYQRDGMLEFINSQDPMIAEGVNFIIQNKYWKIFGKEINNNYQENVPQDTMHEMGISTFSEMVTHSVPRTSSAYGKEGSTGPSKYWPHWNLDRTSNNKKTLKEKLGTGV